MSRYESYRDNRKGRFKRVGICLAFLVVLSVAILATDSSVNKLIRNDNKINIVCINRSGNRVEIGLMEKKLQIDIDMLTRYFRQIGNMLKKDL